VTGKSKRGRQGEIYGLALACTRGREAIVSQFRQLLHEHELTEQQWRVLRALFEQGEKETTLLCELCCIHKVSMMRILRALEERKLVRRSLHREDQRRHMLALTGQGGTLMARLMPQAHAIYDEILDRFGRANARELARLLAQLHAASQR